MTLDFDWNKFQQIPIIGILRNFSIADLQWMVSTFEEAGLSTLEVTMNTPDAIEQIQYLNKTFPGLNIGAGTVCNEKDLEKALNAGACFIVTPILKIELIRKCLKENIPIFPGSLTPTEIYTAWEAGASAIKVFPGSQFGPSYIKEVRGPLDSIKLIPTGGVSLKNIRAYKDAGAYGFGMGGGLFDKKLVNTKDRQGLKTHFIHLVDLF